MSKRKNNSNKIGETFENRIQAMLDRLKLEGRACMSKVPTEFKIVRVMGKIVSAFPVSESKFCDYTGVVKGIGHCDIEAKTTSNKTSFPLSNIKDTQFDYFRYMFFKMGQKHLYYIIEFRELKHTYLVKAMDIDLFKQENERKSIPIQWFEKYGMLLDDDLDFTKYLV